MSAPARTVVGMSLTTTDREILDFAAMWWKYPGAKDSAIRERWGFSSTTYYQRLNALLDNPDALAYAPMVVRRELRLREERRAARAVARGHL